MSQSENLRKIEKLDDQELKGAMMSTQNGCGDGESGSGAHSGSVRIMCPDATVLECWYYGSGYTTSALVNNVLRNVGITCDDTTEYCPGCSSDGCSSGSGDDGSGSGSGDDWGSGSGSGDGGDNTWFVSYLDSGSGESYVMCRQDMFTILNFAESQEDPFTRLYNYNDSFLALVTQLLRAYHANVTYVDVERYINQKIFPNGSYEGTHEQKKGILNRFFTSNWQEAANNSLPPAIFCWRKNYVPWDPETPIAGPGTPAIMTITGCYREPEGMVTDYWTFEGNDFYYNTARESEYEFTDQMRIYGVNSSTIRIGIHD